MALADETPYCPRVRSRDLLGAALRVARDRASALRPSWRGIYPRLEDVPVSGPGFSGEAWMAAIQDDARRVMSAGPEAAGVRSWLPTVAALLRKPQVTVLDFGGGLGTACLQLEHSLVNVDVAYHVVEGASVCEAGRRLHVSSAIRYHDTLPTLDAVDVVNARSSLQYIPTWQGLLGSLAEYRAAYMLIEDLPAGRIPTFATAQLNLPGSAIPYWFFSLDEVVREVEGRGYSLLARAPTERRVVQHGFPSSHRIAATWDLLFGRK